MAGKGPAPKPVSQRRRSNKPTAGEWIDLPREGRKGQTPPWPFAKSTPAERGLWQRIWKTPQATMWDGGGVGIEFTAARWVRLTLATAEGRPSKSLIEELRHVEESLGLSMKGMQDRRWRIAPADGQDEGSPGQPAGVAQMSDYRTMAK